MRKVGAVTAAMTWGPFGRDQSVANLGAGTEGRLYHMLSVHYYYYIMDTGSGCIGQASLYNSPWSPDWPGIHNSPASTF